MRLDGLMGVVCTEMGGASQRDGTERGQNTGKGSGGYMIGAKIWVTGLVGQGEVASIKTGLNEARIQVSIHRKWG